MQDFYAETHSGCFRNLPAFVAAALFLKLETKAGTSHLFSLSLFVFYLWPKFKRIFFFLFILLYIRAFGALGLWILFCLTLETTKELDARPHPGKPF